MADTQGSQSHLFSRVDSDIRVEDYLDDKLQSTADLDNVDTLLASIDHQHTQLQCQLDDALEELETARRTSTAMQDELAAQIDEFQKLQHSIDVRLQIVTASDAPVEAIRRLEGPMKRLHQLDLAHEYILLLQNVEHLRKEARSHLPTSPKAALEPYTRLRQLAARLRELQAAADEAAGHLVAYVSGMVDALWNEMKKTMWDEFVALLGKRGWPQVDPGLAVDDEWAQCFEKLLDLQLPEVVDWSGTVSLLPVQVMAHAFTQEFRFHFMSDKPTSDPRSIDVHCLPWVLALLEKWEDFFRDNFGPVVSAKLRGTRAAARLVCMDPACALVTSVLPVLRQKINSALVVAVEDPVFLSKLISELMTLDDAIRSRFNYDGGDPERGWDGLASEVLAKHFDLWLVSQKSFMLEQYKAAMLDPSARAIDYDYAGLGKTKPTAGAVRVTTLLRTVTRQYERVRNFSHKLRFLIDIQLTVLDEYHDLLRGSLEVYVTATSAVGRTLHGVTREQQAALEGVGALETLCKVYGSAGHIVDTLRDWSNEEFFIDLWDELQVRFKMSRNPENVADDMSYDQIMHRTSSAVGTEADGDGGLLFDETIDAFTQMKKRAQTLLNEAVVASHHKVFGAYVQRAQWTTISENVTAIDLSQLAITPELDEPLGIITRNLTFLSRTLSTAVLRRIMREVLEKLSSMLWHRVLACQNFTALGAAQFACDMHAITALVERYIPHGSSALVCLTDAVKLLTLPVKKTGETGVTLEEASRRVRWSEEEATKLLEELDIDSFGVEHARLVLLKRVVEE